LSSALSIASPQEALNHKSSPLSVSSPPFSFIMLNLLIFLSLSLSLSLSFFFFFRTKLPFGYFVSNHLEDLTVLAKTMSFQMLVVSNSTSSDGRSIQLCYGHVCYELFEEEVCVENV
jgi:hypothetical protein